MKQMTTESKTVWTQAAPLKSSKRKALADLAYCIKDEAERAKYRVVKCGSRWAIEYGHTVSA